MEENKSFSDLGLRPWLVRQCENISLKKPTQIQTNCIPEILNGRDVIGAAKTGSGKTLTFALPIVQTLSNEPYGIYALILTPVRELAFQIADQFSVIGKPLNLSKCVIVGGMDMVDQGKELAEHPHIVVATPGRLADHIESCNTFDLSKIKYLVMDEADRLLEGAFDKQISTIFKVLPKKKQCLFFSATITDTLEKLKEVIEAKSGTDVFVYEAPAEVATVEQLVQHYVFTPYDVCDAYLVEVIRTFRQSNENGSIMIFTDTCRKCQVLSMTLNEVGFDNVALHAMISQSQRLAALSKFKSSQVKILIATDVASRGLDIPLVQLVLNHNVSKIPKEYIHRVGRTARSGRGGMAITLVTPNDIKNLHAIEERIGTKLTEYKVSDKEVGQIFTQISVTESEAAMKLDEKGFYEKKLINLKKKWALDGLDPEEEEAKLFERIRKKERVTRKKDAKKLAHKKKLKAKKTSEEIK